MKRTRVAYLLLSSIIIMLVGFTGFSPAMAAEPERGIEFTATYPDIVVKIGENIEVPVTVTNTGKAAEDVNLMVVSGLEGWESHFEGGYPKQIVRAVYLPSKEVDEYKYKQELTFKVTPPKDVKAGDYRFILKAASKDGAAESSLGLAISLSEKVAAAGGLKLSTTYPVMRGACGTEFEFKVDLKNETKEDLDVGLSAGVPRGWEVLFKPAYQEKQISSIRLKADETTGLDVAVTPLPWQGPGEYTVTVQTSAGAIKDTLDLKVVLTGSYEFKLTTETGRLDTKATAGKENNLSIFAVNTGSADIHDVTFSSTKPEGWVITFSPDKIDSLPTGMQQEVNVAIEPAAKSIAGDYMVTLNASSEQTSETMVLRVAVGTPTTWGWIGVGIIVLVIAGLAVLFTRLGRR